MAKSPTAKTNGHTVAALKPAAPKKSAAPAGKPAVKAAVRDVAKPAPKTLAKTAVKTPAKDSGNAEFKVAAKPALKPALKPAGRPAVKPAVKAAAGAPANTVVTPAAKAAPVRKAAAKPAAKTAVKPSPRSAVKSTPAAADAPQEAGRDKVRKAKLVRDSFTMPEQEYAVLGQVKKACIKAGFEIKKSELLRIGVALISQLDMATLQKVLDSLPQLTTGRPRND